MVDDGTNVREPDDEVESVSELELEVVGVTDTDIVEVDDPVIVVIVVDVQSIVDVTVLEHVNVDDIDGVVDVDWEPKSDGVDGCDSVVVISGEAVYEGLAEMQLDGEILCVTELVIDVEPERVSEPDDDAVTDNDGDDDLVVEIVNVVEIEFVGDLDCDVVIEFDSLAD